MNQLYAMNNLYLESFIIENSWCMFLQKIKIVSPMKLLISFKTVSFYIKYPFMFQILTHVKDCFMI